MHARLGLVEKADMAMVIACFQGQDIEKVVGIHHGCRAGLHCFVGQAAAVYHV
jgi:hypothetical protein